MSGEIKGVILLAMFMQFMLMKVELNMKSDFLMINIPLDDNYDGFMISLTYIYFKNTICTIIICVCQ